MPFSSLYLSRYRINLLAKTPIFLSPYKGSALRGVFGYVLKKLVCVTKDKDCQSCLLRFNCVYAYLFETLIPEADPDYKKYKKAAHPYIIIPPLTKETHFDPETPFSCELILIGKANNYLPYFIYAFSEMGKFGLGKRRGKFRLINVESIYLDGSKAEIYNGKEETLKSIENRISYNDFMNEPLNKNEITLLFETPVRIKEKGDLLSLYIPFDLLIERLCERATLLSYYHCGSREKAYNEFLKGADEIKIKETALQWYDWQRYSRRKGSMKLGGLIGYITYKGNLEKFYPLLKIGEYIHVGKAVTFGLGKYRLK